MSDDLLPEDDFMSELRHAMEAWEEPAFTPTPPKPYPEQVELTQNQKRLIIEYLLGGGCGKGIFEDCPEFWEKPDGSYMDMDEMYDPLRDAADNFVEEIKQHLLKTL